MGLLVPGYVPGGYDRHVPAEAAQREVVAWCHIGRFEAGARELLEKPAHERCLARAAHAHYRGDARRGLRLPKCAELLELGAIMKPSCPRESPGHAGTEGAGIIGPGALVGLIGGRAAFDLHAKALESFCILDAAAEIDATRNRLPGGEGVRCRAWEREHHHPDGTGAHALGERSLEGHVVPGWFFRGSEAKHAGGAPLERVGLGRL